MLPAFIGTDRPQRQLPLMNLAIIAANIIIYILSHHVSIPPNLNNPANLAPGWEKYMLTPTAPHLYQFLTYQFLHENTAHIFFNMLFLYIFGNNLNEKLGHAGYLIFYLTGGVLAGCGQMLTSPSPTLGASGAISAITGMFLVLLPRTHIRIYLFVGLWEIPSAWFILFSIGKDILEPTLWHDTSTAYAAHLTGNLAGILVGLFLLLTHLVQRDHYDLLSLINRYRRRKQYEAIVSAGYNPFGPSAAELERVKTNAAPATIDPRTETLRLQITELIHAHQLPQAAQKYLELRQLDPKAVLPAEDQLDIANQLMSETRHTQAAAAYEDFFRYYPTASQREHTALVLALIYTQYLPNTPRAIELLEHVIPRLHDPKQHAFATEELARLKQNPQR